MARILAISSYVARGHVGLSAMLPALQRLGHEVIGLPTTVLSNHPGHSIFAGAEIDPERLRDMLAAIQSNGWLNDVQALVTGYLPTVEHVRIAADAASRVSSANTQATFYCDPIIGDDPKGLYVAEETALAIRDELLPLADMALPNRFELEWLSGRNVRDIATAFDAACELPCRSVLATSIPGLRNDLINLWATDGEGIFCPVPKVEKAPHGTGDLFAALFIGFRLKGGLGTEHLGRAAAGVSAVLTKPFEDGDLQLISTAEQWSNPIPLPIYPVTL
jgi:pyridoxine kinase